MRPCRADVAHCTVWARRLPAARTRHTAAVTTTVVPRDPVQRHIVRTLVGSQVLGGVGLSAGIAVGALLAEDVSGSAEFAGLGGTFQVLGAALIAIPMSRLMAARGRRPGLVLGLRARPPSARSG